MKSPRDGDANTKLFHTVADGRRTKNYIASVRVNDEVFRDQERKEEAFSDAYNELLGNVPVREHTINLDQLTLPHVELQELERMITEKEVWGIVKELPPDRVG
jgi:hypothetical protein